MSLNAEEHLCQCPPRSDFHGKCKRLHASHPQIVAFLRNAHNFSDANKTLAFSFLDCLCNKNFRQWRPRTLAPCSGCPNNKNCEFSTMADQHQKCRSFLSVRHPRVCLSVTQCLSLSSFIHPLFFENRHSFHLISKSLRHCHPSLFHSNLYFVFSKCDVILSQFRTSHLTHVPFIGCPEGS